MIVVAWNMGRRHRAAAWRYLLDDLKPDLALIQEASLPPDGSQRGNVLHGRAYAAHTWGSAIYVREGSVRELPLPAEHRGWLMAAEIEVPGAEPMVAISVHARILDGYVRPNLDRAFEAVEPLLRERSFVLGGDLNLSRKYDTVYGTSHHTEFLDGLATRGFFDCVRKFHPQEQRTFWGRTKHDYQNDHLFVSDDLAARVDGCAIVDRAQSDHSPLRLTLGSAAKAIS